MIESGWCAGELKTFSAAKLVWIHRRHQTVRIADEMRWMLNATAAANTGANGGDAAQGRFKELERELKRLNKSVATAEKDAAPKSKMPLCREDFERMMADETLE